MNTRVRGVRLVYDGTTQTLFYHSFQGDVFRIDQPVDGQPTDVPIASAADHGIGYLQGMAFANGVMVLAGNVKQDGQQGYGLVTKGILQANGTWRWERVMQTDPYPLSATLYDHAFSAVCVTPNKRFGARNERIANGPRRNRRYGWSLPQYPRSRFDGHHRQATSQSTRHHPVAE